MTAPTSKLRFDADRKERWNQARAAYERWHVTGDAESKQAQSWMAGYVSSLADATSANETPQSALNMLSWLRISAMRRREIDGEDSYAAKQLDSAADMIEEHDQSFDLRWKADMRAIKRWQAAAPGRELTWPDHADLCVWLLEQLESRPVETSEKHGPCAPMTLVMESLELKEGESFRVQVKEGLSDTFWYGLSELFYRRSSQEPEGYLGPVGHLRKLGWEYRADSDSLVRLSVETNGHSTSLGQGADATTAAAEPVCRPEALSLPTSEKASGEPGMTERDSTSKQRFSNQEVFQEALQRIADGIYTEIGAQQHAKDILKAVSMRPDETADNSVVAREMAQAEWRHIQSVLRDAQQRLQADGVRHSWMDGAVGIAEARSKGEGLSLESKENRALALEALALNVLSSEERCANLQRFPNGCGECLYCQAVELMDRKAFDARGDYIKELQEALSQLWRDVDVGGGYRAPTREKVLKALKVRPGETKDRHFQTPFMANDLPCDNCGCPVDEHVGVGMPCPSKNGVEKR